MTLLPALEPEFAARTAHPGLRSSGLARFAPCARPTAFRAGVTIYAEGSPADLVYEVLSGMVRTLAMTNDGRRVVHGFAAGGDVFGVERGDVHACCAEAVSDCVLVECQRMRLERLALTDATAANQLWSGVLLAAEQARERMALARGSALKRVARFLLQMTDKLHAAGRLDLPMSRYDVGDYLGLSSETVSRMLTALREKGVIATEGRAVVVLRPEALHRLDAL